MRRFITALLVFGVAALLVYNVRQVSLLRHEVADLKSQVTALKSGRAVGPSGSSGESTLLTKARQHIDRAKEDIVNGNLKRGRAELEEGLRLMQQAYDDTGAQSTEALKKAQRTFKETRTTVEDLLRKLDSKPEKGKGG